MKIFKNIFKADKSKQIEELETEEEKEEREFTELLNKRKQINVETTRITPIYSQNPINHDSQVYNSEDTSKKEDTTQKNEVLDKLYLRRKQIAEFKIKNLIYENYSDSRNAKYQTLFYNKISDEKINQFAIEYLEKYKNSDLKNQVEFLETICKNNEKFYESGYVFINLEDIENYINTIKNKSNEELQKIDTIDKAILTEELQEPTIRIQGKFDQFKVINQIK